MKDRLKTYLVIVSVIFLLAYVTSEYLAGKVDEEVELYNQHVSILYNAHEILYHMTAIKEGIYSLEYGSFEDAKPIKPHIEHFEKSIKNFSKGISYVFLAGRDD